MDLQSNAFALFPPGKIQVTIFSLIVFPIKHIHEYMLHEFNGLLLGDRVLLLGDRVLLVDRHARVRSSGAIAVEPKLLQAGRPETHAETESMQRLIALRRRRSLAQDC